MASGRAEQAKIRVVNKSNRQVEIIWIGYTGQLVSYQKLTPNQYLDINTFTNHPWIAVDSVTRDNLHLNHKEIFIVENFSCDVMVGNEKRRVTQADIRIPVFITLPLDSLKMCAIKVVRDLISDVRNINCLELPNVLKSELEKSFEYKHKNCQIVDTVRQSYY